ncbi:MAG: hypothetical protein QW581_05185 [Archaeoglobaceae archaeon]
MRCIRRDIQSKISAYVFLKAILEYPARFGKQLVEDVEKYGKWVIQRLKEDQLIKELYDEDVAVYIGSWEVKCPNCGRWTPIVGNWWLARVKGDKGYERLAFFDYIRETDEIIIVDLGGDPKAEVNGREIRIRGEIKSVPEPNVDARRNSATCLHCKAEIKTSAESKGEWHVKWALKKFNEGDNSFARQRLLVKVKIVNGDLKFEPCNQKDQEKLEIARREVEKLLQEGDPDIPMELFAPYQMGTAGAFRITLWGFDKFYKLFNPRQLLTLVKLVKLIREAGKRVEEDKLREGWDVQKAWKYAEAVTTYLAMALCKYVNYNSLVTRWHPTLMIIGESLSIRGIAMMWNWVDSSPDANITGSLDRNLGNLVESLQYLINATSSSISRIEVVLDDATVLSKVEDKFDLIVADPPYRDDVPYAELSDFYYVWLKRALSDVENGKLKPRFLPEAFFKKIGAKYKEIETQWQEFAKREISYNEGRFKDEGIDALEHYKKLLVDALKAMKEKLKEEGVIGLYFAHSSFEAWAELIEALVKAGLMMTNAFPLATESKDRVTGRGKLTMDTSLFVVCRPSNGGEITLGNLRAEIEDKARRSARHLAAKEIPGRDVLIGTMIAAIAPVTAYSRILTPAGEAKIIDVLNDVVYPIVGKALASAYAETSGIKEDIRDPYARFYLLAKVAFGGGETTRPFTNDDVLTLCRASGIDKNAARFLVTAAKVKSEDEEEGSKVANPKAVKLIEITDTSPEKVRTLLSAKKLPLTEPEPRNALDAYHYLLYFAAQYSNERIKQEYRELAEKYEFIEDAYRLAKIVSKMKNGAEKILSTRLVNAIEGVS